MRHFQEKDAKIIGLNTKSHCFKYTEMIGETLFSSKANSAEPLFDANTGYFECGVKQKGTCLPNSQSINSPDLNHQFQARTQ